MQREPRGHAGLGKGADHDAVSLSMNHPLYSINALTLRQLSTPPRLLGRVNATLHVVERGVIPFGALAAGLLGDAIGLRPTLLLAAAGIAIGAIWAGRSGFLRQQ